MRIFILLLSLLFSAYSIANTGAAKIDSTSVEWGHVYIVSSNFANPKQCGIATTVKLDNTMAGFQ